MGNDKQNSALKQAAESLDRCVERHRALSDGHGKLTANHTRIRDITARMRTAADQGDAPTMRSMCGALKAETDKAVTQHFQIGDAHRTLGRSLEDTKLLLDDAEEDERSAGYVEPTHNPDKQGGTMTSDGRIAGGAGEPRGFSLEEIRQRDQRRGCEAGYLAKIKALRA